MISLKTGTVGLLKIVSHTILEHSVVDGVTLWRLGINRHRGCTPRCSFGLCQNANVCAHCLEGGLRTVNLYLQVPPGADCPYLRAANKLRAWNASYLNTKPPKVVPLGADFR